MGSVIRAVRRKRRLRQTDVATLAAVGQTTVSRIERGHLDEMSLATLRRVGRILDVQLQLAPRWRGGELDRLLDRDHARLVEHIVALLRAVGWEVTLEYGFNVYGERGSVDVIGWRPEHDAVLIVEAKTRLVDLQDLLASMDRKARLVPRLLAADRGWQPRVVGRCLAVVGSTANRAVVGRHLAIFASTFPERWMELRPWLRAPARPIRALWMISPNRLATATRRDVASQRVRRRPECG